MGRISHNLSLWGIGTDPVHGVTGAADHCTVLVLESGEHLPALLASGVTGPGSTIFVPGGDAAAGGAAGGAAVVGYAGSLGAPGAEMSLNDRFFLRTQSYGRGAHLSVLGPTLVRIADSADFAAYLADADQARFHGVFAELCTHPAVQLADLSALGEGGGQDGPATRLHIAADGAVSTSPGGLRIGVVGDGLDQLGAAWSAINARSAQPCAVCLGAVVGEAERSSALLARPWLGRYLAAVAAVRALRVRGCFDLRVSGFGDRLSPGLTDFAFPADSVGTELPLLLWTSESAYLAVPGGRVFSLEFEAAALAEALLVTGSMDLAVESARTSLGLDANSARAALHAVAESFGGAGVALTAPPPGVARRPFAP